MALNKAKKKKLWLWLLVLIGAMLVIKFLFFLLSVGLFITNYNRNGQETNLKICQQILENKKCNFQKDGWVECRTSENSSAQYPYGSMCTPFEPIMAELRKRNNLQNFGTQDGAKVPQEQDVRFNHYWGNDGKPLPLNIQGTLNLFVSVVNDIYKNHSPEKLGKARLERLIQIKSCLEDQVRGHNEDIEHLAVVAIGNVSGPLLETGQAYEKFRKSHSNDFDTNGTDLKYFPSGTVVDACRRLDLIQ